ncbi:MAG: hypothetical protein ABIH03_09015 [Pseudomonadota bacterium]
MAKLDPFTAQIVKLVRNMPDEAILELVRNQLGGVVAEVAVASAPAAPAKRRGPKRRREAAKTAPAVKTDARATVAQAPKRRSSADRKKVLFAVERAVKTSKGLSASEIASRTKFPQSRVTTAVRELKAAKRIFQGGDRRFARYAGDARTAKQASLTARNSASGPKRK